MKKAKWIWAVLIVCLFSCMFTVSAEAASYQNVSDIKEKVGKYYFWKDNSGAVRYSRKKNGPAKTAVNVGWVNAITNGTNIYYGESGSDDLSIYRYSISTGKTTYIGNVKHADGVTGYYKGKLYLTRHNTGGKWGHDYTDIHTYSYDLKTGKTKRVMKSYAAGESYGRYQVGMPNSGAIMEFPLKMYDAKTGRTKTITKTALSYNRIGKYIYYADGKPDSTYMWWNTRIYRYNPQTGQKKALGKSFRTCGITKLRKTYVEYMTSSNGEMVTKKMKF